MLAHFLLAQKTTRSEHKNKHWDVFQKNFESVITATDAWPGFYATAFPLDSMMI
jgi:hypothetical protein